MSVISMRWLHLVTDPPAKPGHEDGGSPGDPTGRSREFDALLATFRVPADFPEQVVEATQEVATRAASALRQQTAVPLVMIASRGSQDLDPAMYVEGAGHP